MGQSMVYQLQTLPDFMTFDAWVSYDLLFSNARLVWRIWKLFCTCLSWVSRSGISSCLTSLNFWVTTLNLRSYCLTLKTMPLFPWAILITAAMLLLTLPVLSGALLMVFADLHSNTLFFDPV